MKSSFAKGSRLVSLALAVLLGACAGSRQEPSSTAPQAANEAGNEQTARREGRSTKAQFQTAEGVNLEAVAQLEEVSNGVRIQVDVRNGVPPRHGVHIHEKPDCSDIRNKSMGAHFAPIAQKHGLPNSPEHHFGDMGNVDVASDGTGTLDIVIADASLSSDDPLSLVGRAIVIHETEDVGPDAQPAGNSGAPIACAVISSP